MRKHAQYTLQLPENKVGCQLCAHNCLIPDGGTGLCRVRKNVGGQLELPTFGMLSAAVKDPIEKRPLHQFLPNSWTYAVGSFGCNFRCQFCQNAGLSQCSAESLGPKVVKHATPEAIVETALRNECQSVSFTFVEATVSFEYVLETFKYAKQAGLSTVLNTNGYLNQAPTSELLPFLDAANIDLKGFSDQFYARVCGATLEPVCQFIQQLAASKTWIEISTVIIPGVNDSIEELSKLTTFLANINPDIPWHIAGFHAAYRMKAFREASGDDLQRARAIAKDAGLRQLSTTAEELQNAKPLLLQKTRSHQAR